MKDDCTECEKIVIKLSIKFMRLLNSWIVDQGFVYNTKDRETYRGIDKEILKEVKEGQVFRFITWNATSESRTEAESFMNSPREKFKEESKEKLNGRSREKFGFTEESTLIKFNIKKYCYNAGKINVIGESEYSSEDETLIPPYSVCVVKKIEPKYFELDLARDNKKLDFKMISEF